MTAKDKDRIECAIRHIQTAVDVDPWAVEIAVEAMEKEISALQAQEAKAQLSAEGTTSDLISRREAIDALDEQIKFCDNALCDFNISLKDEYAVKVERASLCAYKEILEDLPSAQPEPCEDAVSREAAIDVAENAFVRGLLASPDIRKLPSVQPESCEDAVSRDSVKFLLCKETCHPGAFCPDGFCREICEKVDALPSATPKQRMGEWIPVSERLPDTRPVDEIGLFGEKCGEFMLSDPVLGYVCGLDDDVSMAVVWYEDDMDGVTRWTTAPDCMDVNVIAWMPLPEPYRAERRTDEGD